MTANGGVALTTADLRREVRLLLALATLRWSAEAESFARATIEDGGLDWPYFMDQALRQQVAGLVSRNILRHRLLYREADAEMPYAWIVSAIYETNARRNRSLFAEFARIFRSLRAHDVRFAVRKGPSLFASIYDDLGIRRMSDLDLLIESDSFDTVKTALADLGYAQGITSRNGAVVVPHDRETELFWSMHLNNALPFKKPTTDPDVGIFDVDVCFNLFQQRSSGRLDTATVLDRAVPKRICGEDAYGLCPLDHLLDLCLHLYKDATSYKTIELGRDLNLMRFLDVSESLRAASADELAALPTFASEVGAARELYYTLYFTNVLFADAVPAALLDELAPADISYLDEYGQLDGKPERWQTEFLTRLFDPGRRMELPTRSAVPYS